MISPAQKIYFLQDVSQMAVILLVSVVNHHNINGLHLFWDIKFNICYYLWSRNVTLHLATTPQVILYFYDSSPYT